MITASVIVRASFMCYCLCSNFPLSFFSRGM